MISRHWKGVVQRARADECAGLIQGAIIDRLRGAHGFIRMTFLRREAMEGVEFQIVTVWESLDAARAFTGADGEAGAIPMGVQALMLSSDRQAVHYDVIEVSR